MKALITRNRKHPGYTLVEALAAGAVVAVGLVGAASLSSSLVLQEEMIWRNSVTKNYHENMARLWQLGLSPTDAMNIIPRIGGQTKLIQSIDATTAALAPGAQYTAASVGTMESAGASLAASNATLPAGATPPLETVQVYRRTLKPVTGP